MQAQNVLKFAANKMTNYQKWGFSIPILTYPHKRVCATAEPLSMSCVHSSWTACS